MRGEEGGSKSIGVNNVIPSACCGLSLNQALRLKKGHGLAWGGAGGGGGGGRWASGLKAKGRISSDGMIRAMCGNFILRPKVLSSLHGRM